MNKTQHDDEARAISNMLCAHVRNAELLGQSAATLRLSRCHDPFAGFIDHDILSRAWLRGLNFKSDETLVQGEQ